MCPGPMGCTIGGSVHLTDSLLALDETLKPVLVALPGCDPSGCEAYATPAKAALWRFDTAWVLGFRSKGHRGLHAGWGYIRDMR